MASPESSTLRSFQDIKVLVKERADLASIVGKHTKLVKTKDGFKACCPLPGHKEKSPSFHVNTRDNYFYCYGCNRGGDVFKFLELVEGLPFFEALKDLAASLSIEIPKKFQSEGAGLKKGKLEEGYEILDRALNFYQRNLLESDTAQSEEARQYLKGRQMSLEDVQTLGLGWAPPESNPITRSVTSDREAFVLAGEVGLVKDYNGRHYDFFQDRLMIPIRNARGKVVAFSGRSLKPVTDRNPKYKNSPETEWFKKKNTVYGLDLSASQIREHGFVCFVEGFFDQWALWRRGIPAVAIMGTALTEEHLQLLERHTKEAVLILDVDQAGINSTKKSLPVLLERDWTVKVFSELDGKDPDEWLRDKKSLDLPELLALMRSAPEALEWWAKIILKESRAENLSRSQIFKALVPIWQLAKTETQKTLLCDELSRQMGLGQNQIRTSLEELSGKEGPRSANPAPTESASPQRSFTPQNNFAPVNPLARRTDQKSKLERAAEEALILWLRHWDALHAKAEFITLSESLESVFAGTPVELLATQLKKSTISGSDHPAKQLLAGDQLENFERSLLLKGMVNPLEVAGLDESKILKSLTELFGMINKEKVHLEISRTEHELRLTPQGQTEKRAQLLHRIQSLRMSLENRK